MELHMVKKLHKTHFLAILFFLFHFNQVVSQFHFFDYYCDNSVGNYSAEDTTYKKNIAAVLTKLTDLASLSHFNNHSVGITPDKAYGLYLCRGDLVDQQCHDCVEKAVSAVGEKCPVQKGANVWYQECMVRYSNQSIFGYEDESLFSARFSISNVTDPKTFGKIFGKAANNTIMQAAYNESKRGYATTESNMTLFESLYIMAICTQDILGSQCERCLRVALSTMGGCCGTARTSLEMYMPSCWLRYANAPFIKDRNPIDLAPEPPALAPPTNTSSSFPKSPPKGASTRTTLSPIWTFMAFLLLIAVGIPNNIAVL